MTDMLGKLDKLRLLDESIDQRVSGIAYKEYTTAKQRDHWKNLANISIKKRNKILREMGIIK